MAQTTRSGIQTRNFLLTQALHLEGKLDWTLPAKSSFFGTPTVAAVLATPPGTYLKLIEAQIDPAKSAELEKTIQITFTDGKDSWALHVRYGVVELTESVPDKVDATLEIPRSVWAQMVLGETTLEQAIADKKAKVTGSEEDLIAVFASFDQG